MGGQWATSHWFKDSRVPATGSDSGAPATGLTTAGRQPLVQRQHGTSHWFKDSRASATGSDSGAPASGSKAVGHLPLVQRQQAQATGSKTAGTSHWFKDSRALLVQRHLGTTASKTVEQYRFKDSEAPAPGSKTVGYQPLVQRQWEPATHWFKDKDMFVVQDLRVHRHIREGSVWWGKGEGTAIFHL